MSKRWDAGKIDTFRTENAVVREQKNRKKIFRTVPNRKRPSILTSESVRKPSMPKKQVEKTPFKGGMRPRDWSTRELSKPCHDYDTGIWRGASLHPYRTRRTVDNQRPKKRKMMSLVSTPVVVARAAAPKKVQRKIQAKASAEGASKTAVAGALALTLLAQPALAQVQEISVIADGDKKAAAAALAASMGADLEAKKNVSMAKNPAKTKNLAIGLPSFSAPKISLPSGGGAPAAKAPKEKAAPGEGPNPILGGAMLILFSPLLAVAAISAQTLARVVPQAADGKDFFTKDTMPF